MQVRATPANACCLTGMGGCACCLAMQVEDAVLAVYPAGTLLAAGCKELGRACKNPWRFPICVVTADAGHVRSFLGVPTPATPFPRHNEGVREMAMQIVRFILRNPLEVMGLRRYEHRGPLTFDAI